MTVAMSVLDAIGNTPLIRLRRASEATGCEILGKAEFMNPGQSVKDRAALYIIRDAEKRGLLRPGGRIVEGTAGNTGMTMYFATKIFGLIPGLIRPCLGSTIPVNGGKSVLLDIGANADCRPEFLVQFAQMGAVYSHLMLGVTDAYGTVESVARDILQAETLVDVTPTENLSDRFAKKLGMGMSVGLTSALLPSGLK